MLKQGQRIRYTLGDDQGLGRIVGKALEDLPFIGGTYIIEPDDSIKSESYPYSHFVANEL